MTNSSNVHPDRAEEFEGPSTGSGLGTPEHYADLFPDLVGEDADAVRLGYGGGYYDRTIKSLREKNKNTLAIGLAFENQECSSLPSEEFDVPLDAILHNKGLVFFH